MQWSCCCVLGMLLCLPGATAQSRKELEDKRLKLIQEINQTNQKLQETQKNKAATLERYIALRSQVKKRQQLVATMQEEIADADTAIIRSESVMEALNDDIRRLRNEYAQMLRTAWRIRLQQSHLAFILSAKSLNQALQRRQYVRQYERYRRRQAKLIEETQLMLSNKISQLEKRKTEQQSLIVSVEEQAELLRGEMLNKDKALQSLKADENRLVKDLERREKERERFSSAIEQIIRNEMAQKRKDARTAPPPRKITSPAKANEERSDPPVPDNSGFGARKGSLTWPVGGGRISRAFGPQPHPTLKGVTVPNNGVDISAPAGSAVSSVHTGKVVGVQFIPGYQNMVIVQHGAYYTVYSNLESLSVSKGDEVAAGQAIGKLGSDDLHFEVWREKQRLNPAGWLR
ncbi:MAG: peptidoglycan DD-metalloendopeptidase family protein [Saprospiraceae bacterium]|nr:peptidoglycan DD-metalloendopeptidase family protein [Saprospiraceae bacterium]